MSQRAFLASLDADLHAAFAAAGMADTGTYTAPGGSPATVRVYVDGNIAEVGSYAPTFGYSASITLLRADVPDPVAGATVTVDGETYTLAQPLEADEGITKWGAT